MHVSRFSNPPDCNFTPKTNVRGTSMCSRCGPSDVSAGATSEQKKRKLQQLVGGMRKRIHSLDEYCDKAGQLWPPRPRFSGPFGGPEKRPASVVENIKKPRQSNQARGQEEPFAVGFTWAKQHVDILRNICGSRTCQTRRRGSESCPTTSTS